MTVTVRPADPEADREVLLDVLERNLTALPHRLRYEWLYRGNPSGSAWSWLARDNSTDRVVGMASLFPRTAWVGAGAVLCGQIGDFAIDTAHRSLGPAVMLQRATFEPVDRGQLAFCYDCPPDERGMAPFRRLGIPATVRMHRYARLLRTERQWEKRLGRGWISAALAAASNLVLGRSAQRPEPGVEIAAHDGRFGEEFSVLDRAVGSEDVIRSRRSAEELNWRYRDDPVRSYHVVTARRRGELVAYAIFFADARDTFVIDVFGRLSPGLVVALLDAAAAHGARRRVQTLQIIVPDRHDLAEGLAGGRFRYRSEGPWVVAYAAPDSEVRRCLDRSSRWLLRHGDLLA